jgi:transposase-like protein
LSPATLSRLKQGWQDELAQWQQRDLTGTRYVYFLVDGVYFATRLEEARHCILVIIGADASGQKELVGLWDGYRESEQSWKELLLDLKSHGLAQGPTLRHWRWGVRFLEGAAPGVWADLLATVLGA